MAVTLQWSSYFCLFEGRYLVLAGERRRQREQTVMTWVVT